MVGVHYQGYKYLTNMILKCQRKTRPNLLKDILYVCVLLYVFLALYSLGDYELKTFKTLYLSTSWFENDFKIKAALQLI